MSCVCFPFSIPPFYGPPRVNPWSLIVPIFAFGYDAVIHQSFGATSHSSISIVCAFIHGQARGLLRRRIKTFHSLNPFTFPISFEFVIEYSFLRNTLLFQQVNTRLHHSRRTTNISINRCAFRDVFFDEFGDTSLLTIPFILFGWAG